MIELYLENKVGAFMKKRSLLFILFISVFMFVGVAKADEDKTCNAVSLNELRTKAANIKVTYEAGIKLSGFDGSDAELDEDGGIGSYIRFIDIKIYNITSDLYVLVEGDFVDKNTAVATLKNVGADGAATIRIKLLDEIRTYNFTVFSDAYGCSSQTLRKIKLTVPRFNYYSDLDICEDIPDYYLCQSFVTYDIDGSTFFKKVEDYKAKLLVNDGDKEGIKTDDNTGIVSKTISSVSKNKYIVVGIIVVVGVIVTIFVLKRKKSDL